MKYELKLTATIVTMDFQTVAKFDLPLESLRDLETAYGKEGLELALGEAVLAAIRRTK
jgi:hypothetical protein